NLGTGNIGATLFKQLYEQHDFLLDNNDIEVKVVGISNSRKMHFNEAGINLEDWQEDLESNGEIADLSGFMERMRAMNLPNCVFIDNTASKLPATYYEDIFKSNISIVTCNKIANSGDYAQYRSLRDTARLHG